MSSRVDNWYFYLDDEGHDQPVHRLTELHSNVATWSMASAPVALVGATLAVAYLNAKFYISKDLGYTGQVLWQTRSWEKTVRRRRANIFYLFEERAIQYKEARCIWSRSGCFSWTEALERVYQYGQFFYSLGCRPGDTVGVYLINAPEFIFIWLGLLSTGCCPALVNYHLASDALVHVVRLGSFKILIVDPDPACRARIENEEKRLTALGVTTMVLNQQLKDEVTSREPTRPKDEYREESSGTLPIALVYTSGSTGFPKAFRFSMFNVYISSVIMAELFHMTRGPGGDVWYNCMPMYHGTGGFTAMYNLCGGVTLALGRTFSLQGFWADIRDSGSTVFSYVGETIRYLLSNPPTPQDRAHSVKLVVGNGLRPDVWHQFQERFGVPEVAEFFASTDGLFSARNYSRNEHSAGYVGHTGPLAHLLTRNTFVLAALDPETNELWRDPASGFARRAPAAAGGEMLVRLSERLPWPGYAGDPASTEKKIARDVFVAGDAYLRTGDALRRDGDGFWHFLDRLGDTYRWKGENVATTEVATCLGQFPGVEGVIVYGVQLPNHDGRAGCAAVAVAPAQRSRFDWAALLRHMRQSLPAYAVPIFVRVVDRGVMSLAMHNNKPDVTRLRAEGVDPALLGTKVPKGESDSLLWLPSKESSAYVPFQKQDWERICQARARL